MEKSAYSRAPPESTPSNDFSLPPRGGREHVSRRPMAMRVPQRRSAAPPMPPFCASCASSRPFFLLALSLPWRSEFGRGASCATGAERPDGHRRIPPRAPRLRVGPFRQSAPCHDPYHRRDSGLERGAVRPCEYAGQVKPGTLERRTEVLDLVQALTPFVLAAAAARVADVISPRRARRHTENSQRAAGAATRRPLTRGGSSEFSVLLRGSCFSDGS